LVVGWKRTGNDNGKRNYNSKCEIQGSLHYGGKNAAFGRDDVFEDG
jgi:hypothetical protein